MSWPSFAARREHGKTNSDRLKRTSKPPPTHLLSTPRSHPSSWTVDATTCRSLATRADGLCPLSRAEGKGDQAHGGPRDVRHRAGIRGAWKEAEGGVVGRLGQDWHELARRKGVPHLDVDLIQHTQPHPLSAARLLVSKSAKTVDSAIHNFIAVWDCFVASSHTTIPVSIHVEPCAGLCPPRHVSRLRRAMNGAASASKAFGDVMRSNVNEIKVTPRVFRAAGKDQGFLALGDNFLVPP